MNAIIGEAGEITLDEKLLRHLGARAGDRVRLDMMPGGEVRLRVLKGKISDVFGMLKREGQRPISIEEMNEAIAKGWAGEL
jgi:hypothetical protein